MEPTIYRFILRHSKKEQIVLLFLTLVSFPFLYYSLDLPKRIINEALGAKGSSEFPTQMLGVELTQLEFLWVLSGMFLALVCINGGFKYYINVFRGQLGERMLRRLRYELYSRVLRFPLPHFRKVSQGEVIPMITAEVEPLGGFIGDAFALPAFQGGTLLTILTFMFIQDPILGLAAISLYPIQGYIIPKLQRQVNLLGKERVKAVRALSDKIGENISGVETIHANDGARYTLSWFSFWLGRIYDIRYDIYRRKFFIKFLNNFLGQLTPFFFYSIGGYLVITGGLTLGALVAVLAAYKDLSAPWKELLNYYQRKEDSRIKYEQVIEQFDPPGTMTSEQQLAEGDPSIRLDGEVRVNNLGLVDEEGEVLLDAVNLKVDPGERLALVGPSGGGKENLIMLLARLDRATSGQITIGGHDLASLPESVTGRRIGYVGPNAFVFSTTIRENLVYGTKHRPLGPPKRLELTDEQMAARLVDAEKAGNSIEDPEADWIDYEEIGVEDADALQARLVALLEAVDMSGDCYVLGLRGTIDPEVRDTVASGVLEAREAFRKRLEENGKLSDLVEPFDIASYNTNATVAENLLFGTPVGDQFQADRIATHPYVREVLERQELGEAFLTMGRDIASTMVELFADLPPDHEFFAQFSFISPDDLPDFQALISKVERQGMEKLSEEERTSFMALPFKIIPARHRLGMIDDAMEVRLLEARRDFAENLPEDLAGSVAFFRSDAYNAAASIQDNILFGKIAYGQANAADRVGAEISNVLDELGLRETVIEVGLDFHVGIAGSRLSAQQRQKVGLARVLLRRPDLMILNDVTANLDSASQDRVVTSILKESEGRTLVWATQRPELARRFSKVVVLRGGRVVESGSPDELDREGTAYHAFVTG
jgi:ABC-type multidrug transport system fused ATPase/permease subunit